MLEKAPSLVNSLCRFTSSYTCFYVFMFFSADFFDLQCGTVGRREAEKRALEAREAGKASFGLAWLVDEVTPSIFQLYWVLYKPLN